MRRIPARPLILEIEAMYSLLRKHVVFAALMVLSFSSQAADAQTDSGLTAEYTVAVKDTAAHLFHVTATFSNLAQPRLDVALPIWTPGWYTHEFYAKNVRRFVVSDASGTPLAAPLSRLQTWTIDTRGKTEIVIEFDYFANILSHNQAVVTDAFAFFTGTQLFLEPIGHRNVTSSVRFVLPDGWPVISALQETSDPYLWTAPDYDTLVDSPTWLGAFTSNRLDVDGIPHYFVYEAGETITVDSTEWTDIVQSSSAIFGDKPYDKYLVFQLPWRETGTGAEGALEHGNSFVGCCGSRSSWLNAHELFHVWNVKRIRPAELWPYDYSKAVDTPSLWVSEGFSVYYGPLIVHRAGLLSDTAFVARLGGLAATWASDESLRYESPSDASMATWRAYGTSAQSYYITGAVLGASLDLKLLHDTHGRYGLDEVMRRLYEGFYKQNKGFTAEDMVEIVSSIAGHDYSEFFDRYVTGLESPPFDSFLEYAGIKIIPSDDHWYKFSFSEMISGERVMRAHAGSPGEMAGIQEGDILLAMDNVPTDKVQFLYANGYIVLGNKNRPDIDVTIRRNSVEMTIPVVLGPNRSADGQVVFASTPTEEQLAVRRAWLAKHE